MRDAIFGPLLPIKTYKTFRETIAYINSKPRPLAAYYSGNDKAEEQRFLTGTTYADGSFMPLLIRLEHVIEHNGNKSVVVIGSKALWDYQNCRHAPTYNEQRSACLFFSVEIAAAIS